jgi:dTDP-glucose 4,6-dehydratase
MKILITGGAGFIGSAVVQAAVSKGNFVINLDALKYSGYLKNIENFEKMPNYSFERADICDLSEMRRIIFKYEPDAIIHLAAESHVDRSIDGPEPFIKTNVNGTFNLLEVAKEYWISKGRPSEFRFHHVSTDEVYGSLGSTGKFTELNPYAPNSPYSASKAAGDHLVRAWFATYDLPVLITNCSNNYGNNQFPEKLIPTIIINAISGNSIPIYGSGANVRDWLFVSDHVEALLCVLNTGQPGRTYNIGGDSEYTNLEIALKSCEILDQLIPSEQPYSKQIIFVEDRPGHDIRYAVDSTRIQTELGWKPKVSLDEGLKFTIKWYLENKDWWGPLQKNYSVKNRMGVNK